MLRCSNKMGYYCGCWKNLWWGDGWEVCCVYWVGEVRSMSFRIFCVFDVFGG